MKKQSKAIGYITYRKDRKKWDVRYPEYDFIKKKNVMKCKSFKTKEEAKRFQGVIMYQRENPIYIEKNGIPLCELMKANLKLKLMTNSISEITYCRTLQIIEQIEKFPVGSELVDKVTSDEIQDFLNNHKHLSNSSIIKLYQQFNCTMTYAINKGYIMKNPMVNVVRPKSKKEKKEIRALTFDEQQKIADFLFNKKLSNCRYKNVYLIQMFMGLRIGEVLALQWQDIDLERNRLQVKKTLTKNEKGNIIMGTSTKTYSGKRIVPIPAFMKKYIKEQLKYAKMQDNKEQLLFKPNYARYTNRANVNCELKRMLKRHFKIEDITTHCLRHTYGTRCIEAGMAPVVVQKLMGHADIRVTLNTYTSVFDKFKEQEIDKVNEYYKKEMFNKK